MYRVITLILEGGLSLRRKVKEGLAFARERGKERGKGRGEGR